jgi:SynChlorMet cassette protein ScmC
MSPVLENCTEGLHLKLANGQEWSLVATEPFCSWLQKFGSVMGLKPRQINGLPKLVFTSRSSCISRGMLVGDGLGADVPRTGWNRRDYGAMRLWTHPLVQDAVCELDTAAFYGLDVLRMWLSIDIVHANAVSLGGLPLHAGLVVHNGRGVLLAGAGGVGKSTCCKRVPAPWISPCDDEVLVIDKGKEFRGHPFPTWSDYLWGRPTKTCAVQDHWPIKGIVFLKQAQEDRIQPVGRGEAAMLINCSATQVISRYLRGMSKRESAKLKRQVFENACTLATDVPAFILSVALNGTFWVEIEKAIDL